MIILKKIIIIEVLHIHQHNINLKISKKAVVIFHNLGGYDSQLIFKQLIKFNYGVSVMPNGLEKYKFYSG